MTMTAMPRARPHSWLFGLPLVAFGLLAVFLAIGLQRDPRAVPSPLIGKPLPAFAAPLLGQPGIVRANRQMHGKVWLLNVWASWCAPCRQEHGLILAYAREPGAVPVIGLNYKDASDTATRWLAELGNPYAETLIDHDGRIGIDFGVYGVPETFVIDRQGVVRFKHVGPLDTKTMDERIRPLLRQLGG